MENVGESLLSLSNPANHVAPPAFPRFTEDGDHFTSFANMATQPLTYRVDDGRSQILDRLMAAAASSSSSGSPWKYDVFLNFRGEDTRRCFVSHLYKALNQKAINTFIDAEGLRKGNDLSQLLTAIQDSRVSIVVFSQNYASSTWCLKELVQILDCMDRKDQIVVPVFYDVDPSHVRKAESSFAEAFAKHEGHSNADMEEATEAVESIILDLSFSKPKVVYFSSEAFVKMTKLRLLKIHGDNGHSCENLKFLLHELRSLVWEHCPLKSLPSNFIAKNLVELDMQNSLIEHLWEGAKPLENLKMINLTSSPHLKKTPDFTEAKNLEKVVFQSCTSLFEVHPSISSLKNLVLLDLEDCRNLKIFPSKIGMKSLRTLKLSWCRNLVKFPEVSDVMQDLSELYLDYTQIKELPSSISNLTGLVALNIRGCRKLESLPSSISHIKSLEYLDVSGCSKLEKFPEISEELPASILNLTSRYTLKLNECRELESLPSSISHMKSLIYLDVSGCSKLEKFPEILEVMNELSTLCLGGNAIKELPASILNLTSLVTLKLNDCRELESLPSSISHMKSLKYLYVSGCSKLEKFPEISEVMKKLSELCLDDTAIKELPASILNLTSLVILMLNDCRELESLPSSIFHMKSIKYLYVSGCSKLEKFPEISEELPASILNLTSLVTLKLNDCRELESLPNNISHMKSLEYLHVSGCSKLEKFPEISEVMKKLSELCLDGTAIKELPASILNLTSLVTLKLNDCRELERLPSSISHMKSLKHLDVSGCSELEKFPKISEHAIVLCLSFGMKLKIAVSLSF
ncbi:hypothetical protein DVH24_031302 [Malus domestica]|uniref:TIR domain-containing protein n=1 Tax=Malus domestica TaxID=3750 RepID=A0A498HD43_MALDO|nr:hypothetical protein DVH24_031302 [Malus domestica]